MVVVALSWNGEQLPSAVPVAALPAQPVIALTRPAMVDRAQDPDLDPNRPDRGDLSLAVPSIPAEQPQAMTSLPDFRLQVTEPSAAANMPLPKLAGYLTSVFHDLSERWEHRRLVRARPSSLVLLARAGDTMKTLYAKVYRGVQPPPFATFAELNQADFRPGSMVIFPTPPNGWAQH